MPDPTDNGQAATAPVNPIVPAPVETNYGLQLVHYPFLPPDAPPDASPQILTYLVYNFVTPLGSFNFFFDLASAEQMTERVKERLAQAPDEITKIREQLAEQASNSLMVAEKPPLWKPGDPLN